MTSTAPVFLSNKELRDLWLGDVILAAADIKHVPSTSPLWQGLLLLIKRDGPAMASETNEWWPRRFAWISLREEQGVDPRDILIQALADMKFANDNDGR